MGEALTKAFGGGLDADALGCAVVTEPLYLFDSIPETRFTGLVLELSLADFEGRDNDEEEADEIGGLGFGSDWGGD